MPPLLGTAFFRLRDSGWSETYPLVTQDYGIGLTNLQLLVTDRLGMMMNDVVHVGNRVSDLTIKGDAKTGPSQGAGTFTAPAGETDVTAPPNLVLRIRVDADVKPHAVRPLHGIPQYLSLGGIYVPDAQFTVVLNIFLSAYKSSAAILTTKKVGKVKTFTLNTITAANVDGLWTRNTGRPFGQHRGRRKRKR